MKRYVRTLRLLMSDSVYTSSGFRCDVLPTDEILLEPAAQATLPHQHDLGVSLSLHCAQQHHRGRLHLPHQFYLNLVISQFRTRARSYTDGILDFLEVSFSFTKPSHLHFTAFPPQSVSKPTIQPSQLCKRYHCLASVLRTRHPQT